MTTYVTTFFKPKFFEAALGANLTTMLMMTTILKTSLSELTDTSCAKWIDVWLIFSQLVPFTEVILLTLKEAYRRVEADKTKTKKIRRKRRTHCFTNHSLAISTEANPTVMQDLAPQIIDKKVQSLLEILGRCLFPEDILDYVKLIVTAQPVIS